MTGRAISPQEQKAADFVARFYAGTAGPRDIDGSPDMTHDFDVLVGDKVIALKITASSDRDVMRQTAQACKHEWSAPSLSNDWQIGFNRRLGEPSVDLRPARKGMEKVLFVFEQYNSPEVGAVGMTEPPRMLNNPPELIEAVHEMFRLGVTLARSHRPAMTPGGALILPSIHGGHGANANEVNDLVERDAESNAEKLNAAVADERHLWVWVDGTTPEAELAMHTGQMPMNGPNLPIGVDVVWAATHERVMRVRQAGQWERVSTS